MMRSLYAGISGLKNHQTRMDVIGNNIANVNTVGFKGSRVTFQDMLSQTIQGAAGASGNRGGTNPMQIGLGMGLASVDTIFTDGSFQPTGKQTDLAIGGQGFFILSDGENQIYSRAGAFDFDTAGNFLVPGTGYKVMGYKADKNGVIDPNQPIQPINIPVGGSMPSKVSDTVTYANNLSASAIAYIDPAIPAAALVTAQAADTAAGTALADETLANTTAKNYLLANPLATAADVAAAIAFAVTGTAAETAAAAAADGTAAVAATQTALDTANTLKTTTAADLTAANAAVAAANNKTSDVQTAINLYDSQGNSYKLNGTFEKIGENTWSFTPAGTVTDSTGAVVANIAATPSTIRFKPDGSYDTASTINTITINPAGGAYAGAGPFTVTPDFSTMSQYGGESTAQATAQDGYASGTLSKVTIDPTGTIVGQFTNGQSLNLAQVALAVFNNPSGLNKVGESLFTKSNNSGEPQIGQSNTGGRGNFNPGSLEMSNVDLAQQFSDMIVTQRGFQANSKIITTTDSMLEELVNLKR